MLFSLRSSLVLHACEKCRRTIWSVLIYLKAHTPWVSSMLFATPHILIFVALLLVHYGVDGVQIVG